jgi:AcrR family transcriptional regulator
MAGNIRQQQKAASLELMLNKAMRTFAEMGYANTRVADIIEGSGYTAGVFYEHFENKLDCFWQVNDYRQRRRAQWWEIVDDLEPSTTSLEAIVRQVLAGFDHSMKGARDWPPVAADVAQVHRDDPAVGRRLARIYVSWCRELEQFVLRLQRGGWVSAERDPEALAFEVLSFVDGTSAHAAAFRVPSRIVEPAVYDGILAILLGPCPDRGSRVRRRGRSAR